MARNSTNNLERVGGKKIQKLREKFENNEPIDIKAKKKSGKVNTIVEMFSKMERRTAANNQSVQEGWRSGVKRQREEGDENDKELSLERKGKFRIFEI